MKKTFSVIFILLAFILTISCFSGFSKSKAFADQVDALDIESKSAYLIDAHSGMVVYSKNETKRLPISSMCKIMTLLLCFEAQNDGKFSIDDEVVISENAANMGGSQVFLEKNGKGNLPIEVDGNVSYANAVLMNRAGADIFVAGTSSVFSEDLHIGIKKMRDCINN